MSSEANVSTMGSDPSVGKTANIIYILYLVSMFLGFTSIIGVVMAYINKGDGPEWLEAHYQFQIRTFWIAFLFGMLGAFTMLLLVGYFILLFTVVWMIIRSVKGMKYLSKSEAMPNPKSWLFG